MTSNELIEQFEMWVCERKQDMMYVWVRKF